MNFYELIQIPLLQNGEIGAHSHRGRRGPSWLRSTCIEQW